MASIQRDDEEMITGINVTIGASVDAGTGIASFAGDGGTALDAGLRYPFGIAVDLDGALLVADTFNHRIRRLSLEEERCI